jgi:hypothetical protein
VKAGNLRIRGLERGDLEVLGRFSCSTGKPWEDVVEEQVRGPLPLRYLATPPYFDGRMLLGFGPDGDLLVVGAHHIEPSMVPDVGYTEVIAVAREARGVLVEMPEGEQISLGHFMLLVIFQQMRRLGRHARTFVRVDRRNTRSLALLDRVGLSEERDDALPNLIQHWGELPAS